MEAWTGALDLVGRGEFILSTGDQYCACGGVCRDGACAGQSEN